MYRAMGFAAVIAMLAAPVGAQVVKHFKAWTAVCDNLKTCSAFGYADEGADADAFISIARAAGPDAAPAVTLGVQAADGDDGTAPLAWRISVDGKTPAGLEAVATKAKDSERYARPSPVQSFALVAALRAGAAVSISGGGKTATIGLSGSSAALLWIDDRQGRVGTVTALVARGVKPAASVPAAPDPPVIRAGPPVSQTGMPAKLPAAIRASPKLKDCDAESIGQDPTIARLGPGQMLWGAPCSSGAYNLLSVLFIADEAGHGAREIIPPDAQEPNPDAGDELMNIDYDAKTRTLTSFAKARGIGDCGVQSSWVWDGKAFELTDETVMPDCDGVGADDWPSLYHAVRAR